MRTTTQIIANLNNATTIKTMDEMFPIISATCYRCEIPMVHIAGMFPQVCQACLDREDRQYALAIYCGMMNDGIFTSENCTYPAAYRERLNAEFTHRWVRGDWAEIDCNEAAKWFADDVARR